MYIPPEHLSDTYREQASDALSSHPLPVNRVDLVRVVESALRERCVFGEGGEVRVGRVEFISSGTFHKAYTLTLLHSSSALPTTLVMRLARHYMPTLKTLSEVSTISYLAQHTDIPVPRIWAYDASCANLLGCEWMLMDKAKGVSLSSIPTPYSPTLLRNIASILLQLSRPEHRFDKIGSIYFSSPTPTPTPSSQSTSLHSPSYKIGPIISWPFFGSARGHLPPTEVPRGPWSTIQSYLKDCVEREVRGVVRENEGRSRGRRPVCLSRGVSFSQGLPLSTSGVSSRGMGEDEDGDSETDEENEDENGEEMGGSEGDEEEDTFYRDYRASQRGTFLVREMGERERMVRGEMGGFERYFTEVLASEHGINEEEEGYVIDLHDLSRENVFVDEGDGCTITCIIDFESTTTRPLWQVSHLPSLIYERGSSDGVGEEFMHLPHSSHSHHKSQKSSKSHTPHHPLAMSRSLSLSHSLSESPTQTNERTFRSAMSSLGEEGARWLEREESSRNRELRRVHRVLEWDGWEEGLVGGVIPLPLETPVYEEPGVGRGGGVGDYFGAGVGNVNAKEKRGEKMHLSIKGDECNGEGGELGRRLGALVLNGDGAACLSPSRSRGHSSSPDYKHKRHFGEGDGEEEEEESTSSESETSMDERLGLGPSMLNPHPHHRHTHHQYTHTYHPQPHPHQCSHPHQNSHNSNSNQSNHGGEKENTRLGVQHRSASRNDRLAMFLAFNGVV